MQPATGDICEVYAVASADHYSDTEELKVGMLIISEKLTFGALTGPTYNQGLALRGLPIAVAMAPKVNSGENGSDVDVTWTYAATGFASGTDRTDNNEDEAKEDVCSIDDNSGALTPGSMVAQGDFCEVVATVHAPGYVSKAADVVKVLVNDTFASLTWVNFPSSGTVGTDISLSANLPSSDPVAASFSYDTNANCNMVTTSGSEELIFYDTEECVVTVTASKQGYLDFSRSFRVTPAAGTITATFGIYGDIKVNEERTNPITRIFFPDQGRRTAASASITETYEVVNDAACALNISTGRVTGRIAGETVRSRKSSPSRVTTIWRSFTISPSPEGIRRVPRFGATHMAAVPRLWQWATERPEALTLLRRIPKGRASVHTRVRLLSIGESPLLWRQFATWR